MGSMRLSWGQWGSVEIVRGPMGVSGDRWCSMGVFGAHSGSVGLSGAPWGSVRNVYTPLKNDK